MGFSLQSLNPFAGLISANSSGQYLNPATGGGSSTTAAAAPAAPKSNGAFWIGADGKVYVKGSAGTNAAGTADKNTVAYWTGKGFSQINDPVATKTVVQGTGGGTGGTASTFEDKTDDINQLNSALGSVGGYIDSGNAAVDAALAKVNGQYADEDAAEQASYNTNTGQNKVNLTKNQQTALVNAAQGRQGLNATLASLGALNGSGVTLATRAVQKGANEDLTSASDNYATNAQALDAADGTFQSQDKIRKQQAIDAAAAAKVNVQNTALSNQLDYYQKLQGDYTDEGDTANASKYSGLASALFPQIAATTGVTGTPTYSANAYTAPALSSYLAGNSTQVTSTPANGAPGSIPGLVASATKKKVTAATPALATV